MKLGSIVYIGDINSPINEGDTIMSEIAGGLSELLEKATPITDNLGVTISRLNDILNIEPTKVFDYILNKF